MNATDSVESQLRSLLGAAEHAEMPGRREQTGRVPAAARSLAPEHPAVLGACGVHALRKGDAAEARHLLERSIAADASNPVSFFNLASGLRALKDAGGGGKG